MSGADDFDKNRRIKMSKKQIVNIINFIRDVEPRAKVDLVAPVRNQIDLMKKHNLSGTFLLQYDALIDPVYTDMLKTLDKEQFELGAYLGQADFLGTGMFIAVFQSDIQNHREKSSLMSFLKNSVKYSAIIRVFSVRGFSIHIPFVI